MTWRRLLWALPVLLLVLLLGAWHWLMHSEAGANWVFARAVAATGNAMQAGRLSGALASGVTIDGFVYENDRIRVGIDRAALSVGIGFLPLAVTARDLRLTESTVDWRAAPDDAPEGPGISEVLRRLGLPLILDIDGARATGVVVNGVRAGQPIVVDELGLTGRWDDSFSIDDLSLNAPGFMLATRGRLALNGRLPLAVDASIRAEPVVTGLEAPVGVELNAEGDLDRIGFRIDSLASRLSGSVTSPGPGAVWDITLVSPELTWPLAAAEPAYVVRNVELALQGSPADYRVEATAAVSVPGLEFVQASVRGSGDLQHFSARSLDLDDGEVTGSADLDWRDGVSVVVDLAVDSLALQNWIEGWTGGQVLDGQVAGTVTPGRIALRDTRLTIVDGERRLDLDGGVEVTGAIDDWTVAGDIGVATGRFPSGRFVVAGSGDREHVLLDELDGDLLGGTVSGRGSFSWVGEQAWSTSLVLHKIDTASLPFDVAAVLSGTLDTSGSLRPFSLDADLGDIDGSVLGRGFRADGNVRFADGEISARRLSVAHGESSVWLDGQLRGRDGFAFELDVDDLGHYVDGVGGALAMSGRASLDADSPYLRVNGAADSITIGELAIGGIELKSRDDESVVADIDWRVDNVSLRDSTAGPVEGHALVTKERQLLEVDATSGNIALTLAASGALDDWSAPSQWTGELERFSISDNVRSASIRGTAGISVGREEIAVSGLCLDGEQGLRLCADFRRDPSTGTELMANLGALPLNTVNQFFDTYLVFDQSIAGTLEWRQSADGVVNGRGDLALSAGTITNKSRPDSPVATQPGRLTFDIVDGNLQSGIVALPLPGAGRVDGRLQVGEVDGNGTVDGNLKLAIPDLSAIDELLPWIDDARGRLNADFEFGGTIDAPTLAGEITVRDGALRYEPIGLQLDDLSVDSAMDQTGALTMTGNFRAGDGTGRFVTSRGSNAALGMELVLQGENLTLVQVPDVLVVANPDIVVGFDGQTLSLDGGILIPSARVRPQNITVSRVSESGDVVIVAGELPPVETKTAQRGDVAIDGTLEVTLGNDVSIRLDVARTTLTGSATFEWTGDPVPVANGRYDLSGDILAFGQRLDIEEGVVRFPNVRADNPVIRIRAIRDIYGNTEVRQAGVMVSGDARRPTVETFTVPLTTEERALTLLITGSDFDYEQGVGAVDFGTYIAPKLYASYGISIFSQDNVVRLRYDIARGFGITATSGQKESGLDLIYRFEN